MWDRLPNIVRFEALSDKLICEFVMKKDRKLPSAWTVDGNKAFHTFLNKRRDSCFCMRHCNSDITCSAPSREWPQNHSAAEAAVVKIAMAAKGLMT